MKKLQKCIYSSSDFKNKYPLIAKKCKENNEAVVITVNGTYDTVLINYEAYQELNSKIELLETLIAAQDDVNEGRTTPFSESIPNYVETINKIRKAEDRDTVAMYDADEKW